MKKVFIPFMVALCIALGIVIGNFAARPSFVVYTCKRLADGKRRVVG